MSADRDITAASGSIAVVIPCHDDGGTLEEAVDSVLAQDVPAEIIVVDDGSSDPATHAALERVAAAGVRVLRQHNRGPGPARMAGLRATRAEYALPLDADDRLLPGALRLLRAELERNPRAVAAWGSARHFGGPRLRPAQPAVARPLAAQLPEPPAAERAVPPRGRAARPAAGGSTAATRTGTCG